MKETGFWMKPKSHELSVLWCCVAPQKSLGHEVNELTSSRLLKLEMENQTLLTTVEELRNAMGSTEGANAKILKMEKENQRLSKKVMWMLFGGSQIHCEKMTYSWEKNVFNLGNFLVSWPLVISLAVGV